MPLYPPPSTGSYLTSANIVATITNGVTTNAPSEDAVFDALALKQDVTTDIKLGIIEPIRRGNFLQ